MAEENCYRVLMVLAAMEPLKVNILLVLAHVAPQRLSGKELTQLLGYSKKARTIYRGVLDDLQAAEMILLTKIGNQYSIALNNQHPVIDFLQKMVLAHGSTYSEQLLDLLGDLH